MGTKTKRATTTEAHQMLELLNSLRRHDLPPAPVAAGVRPRSHLRAIAGAVPARRASGLAHGRHRQGLRGDLARRHPHRGSTGRKGLAVRGDHPADRRVYVLDLTRAGKALVEELEAIRLRGMERVLARMSAADRQRVLTGLEALVDAAETATADDAARPAGERRAPDDPPSLGRRLGGRRRLLLAACSDNAAGKARSAAAAGSRHGRRGARENDPGPAHGRRQRDGLHVGRDQVADQRSARRGAFQGRSGRPEGRSALRDRSAAVRGGAAPGGSGAGPAPGRGAPGPGRRGARQRAARERAGAGAALSRGWWPRS